MQLFQFERDSVETLMEVYQLESYGQLKVNYEELMAYVTKLKAEGIEGTTKSEHTPNLLIQQRKFINHDQTATETQQSQLTSDSGGSKKDNFAPSATEQRYCCKGIHLVYMAAGGGGMQGIIYQQ